METTSYRLRLSSIERSCHSPLVSEELGVRIFPGATNLYFPILIVSWAETGSFSLDRQIPPSSWVATSKSTHMTFSLGLWLFERFLVLPPSLQVRSFLKFKVFLPGLCHNTLLCSKSNILLLIGLYILVSRANWTWFVWIAVPSTWIRSDTKYGSPECFMGASITRSVVNVVADLFFPWRHWFSHDGSASPPRLNFSDSLRERTKALLTCTNKVYISPGLE